MHSLAVIIDFPFTDYTMIVKKKKVGKYTHYDSMFESLIEKKSQVENITE